MAERGEEVLAGGVGEWLDEGVSLGLLAGPDWLTSRCPEWGPLPALTC